MHTQGHWVPLIDACSLPHHDLARNMLTIIFKAVVDYERPLCSKHYKAVSGATVDNVVDRLLRFSTGTLLRRLLACSVYVAHTQFSLLYPSMLFTRSNVSRVW